MEDYLTFQGEDVTVTVPVLLYASMGYPKTLTVNCFRRSIEVFKTTTPEIPTH